MFLLIMLAIIGTELNLKVGFWVCYWCYAIIVLIKKHCWDFKKLKPQRTRANCNPVKDRKINFLSFQKTS